MKKLLRILLLLVLFGFGQASYAESHLYGGTPNSRSLSLPGKASLQDLKSFCDMRGEPVAAVAPPVPPQRPPQPPAPPRPTPVPPPQATPVVPAATPTPIAPAPTDGAAAWQGLLKHHNEERAKVSSPPLVWSDKLAKQAKEWADKCDFNHNPDLGKLKSGQNIYVSSDVNENITVAGDTASQLWADEKRDYNAEANTCAPGKVCGHYTQMVWKTTTEVGCAVSSCPTGIRDFQAGTIVVCDYGPPGNVVGRRPF